MLASCATHERKRPSHITHITTFQDHPYIEHTCHKSSRYFLITIMSQTKSITAVTMCLLFASYFQSVNSFAILLPGKAPLSIHTRVTNTYDKIRTVIYADATDTDTAPTPAATPRPSAGMEMDHQEPEDAIIHIAPKAMRRLRELQKQSNEEIVLRMGVRNGGCSGLSYVMDFSSRNEVQDDDQVDEYVAENIVCVVDAKSMLYLYGLELDYGDELIGGGFKFFNPNAEESCGCGSSFGV